MAPSGDCLEGGQRALNSSESISSDTAEGQFGYPREAAQTLTSSATVPFDCESVSKPPAWQCKNQNCSKGQRTRVGACLLQDEQCAEAGLPRPDDDDKAAAGEFPHENHLHRGGQDGGPVLQCDLQSRQGGGG